MALVLFRSQDVALLFDKPRLIGKLSLKLYRQLPVVRQDWTYWKRSSFSAAFSISTSKFVVLLVSKSRVTWNQEITKIDDHDDINRIFRYKITNPWTCNTKWYYHAFYSVIILVYSGVCPDSVVCSKMCKLIFYLVCRNLQRIWCHSWVCFLSCIWWGICLV